jgi:hypothetical protein
MTSHRRRSPSARVTSASSPAWSACRSASKTPTTSSPTSTKRWKGRSRVGRGALPTRQPAVVK